MYKLGARKIAVFGLGPLGCTPTEIARFGTGGKPCVDSINNASSVYNAKLKPLVDELNSNFPDARFTFINVTISPSASQQGKTRLPTIPIYGVSFMLTNYNIIFFSTEFQIISYVINRINCSEFAVGPCCQVREDGQCIPNSIPCPDRNLTIFYDGLHPTEITNMGIASRSYNAPSPMDASPYDISSLVQL